MVAEPVSSWVAERVREYEPGVALRDYQQDAAHHVAHAFFRDGKRRIVVVLATGGGKTVVFGAIANGWLQTEDSRVLVLAHRDELIQQAADKMGLWIPRHLIGIVKAERNDVKAPVVVASVQTLRNDNRLAQAGRFGLIVIDECHHAAAASYKKILEDLGAFSGGGPLVLGVTATPKRGDGVGIDDVFEDVVYQKTYTQLAAAGWLVDLRAQAFDLMPRQQRPHYGVDGDYAEGWLGGLMLEANAPDKILEAWQQHAADRPTIVFTPVVSVAKAVAATFQAAGIPSAWVSGTTPIKERRAALDGLRTGAMQVIANCGVLTEGFDEPKVSCIVIGRPTRNETLYIQMVGRGTRCIGERVEDSRAAGKADCLILDMVGCAGQLRLDAVVELAGRKAPAASREVTPATTGDVPFETLDGDLVGRRVSVARSICRWVELPERWFALSLLDSGWITIEADDMGTWTVAHRTKRGVRTVKFPGLSLDLAKSAGEHEAKTLGAFGPMTGRARWLDRPISEKTLLWGMRLGLRLTPETTAWQKTILEAEALYPRWRDGR